MSMGHATLQTPKAKCDLLNAPCDVPSLNTAPRTAAHERADSSTEFALNVIVWSVY